MAEAGDMGEPLPPPMMGEEAMDVKLEQPTDPGTGMPPDLGNYGEEGEEGEGEDVGEGGGDGPIQRRPRLDFLFADEKKKKKKQKKKVKPPPAVRPTRAEYEAVIAELNRTLAQLSKRVMAADEANVKHSTELVETKESHKDVAEHLQRVLEKHMQTFITEEEYNESIKQKREEWNVESKDTIKTLQTQYNQTHSQLLGEIEMLTVKLSTLRVFSDAREDVLKKLGDIEVEYKQSGRRHKDRLYAMQQKAVVERNKLDKEAKARFNRIVDDFNDWREVRNAAYKRRLLTENKELRSKYNKLVPLNLKKERELDVMLEMTASVRDTHAAVYDITKQLENTQAKRNGILEKLEKFKRFYKVQVILGSKYRRLYEAIKRDEMREDEKIGNEQMLNEDLEEQCTILLEKLRLLKQAERDYLSVRQQYDTFVKGVKYAVFSLSHLPEYDYLYPQSFNEYDAKRNVVLKGLVDLITNGERKLTTKGLLKAQYYKGYLGFVPFDTMICDIFKCIDECSEPIDLDVVPDFCLSLSDWSAGCDFKPNQKLDEYSDSGLLCLK